MSNKKQKPEDLVRVRERIIIKHVDPVTAFLLKSEEEQEREIRIKIMCNDHQGREGK